MPTVIGHHNISKDTKHWLTTMDKIRIADNIVQTSKLNVLDLIHGMAPRRLEPGPRSRGSPPERSLGTACRARQSPIRSGWRPPTVTPGRSVAARC